MIKKNGKTIQHIYKHIPGVLPDAYREVEYLESSGTQYIDSGVEAKYSVGIYTKFQCLSNVNAAICGAINRGEVSGYLYRHHLTPFGSGVYWYLKNSNTTSANISFSSQNALAVNTFYLNPATGVYKLNDIVGRFTVLDGTVGSNYGVFGRISSVLEMQSRAVRIYWFIMMDNNVVVRHFIPVVRNSDDKPGMYDVINDTFYTNAGTGEFACGGVVKNKKILQIKDSQGRVIHRDI